MSKTEIYYYTFSLTYTPPTKIRNDIWQIEMGIRASFLIAHQKHVVGRSSCCEWKLIQRCYSLPLHFFKTYTAPSLSPDLSNTQNNTWTPAGPQKVQVYFPFSASGSITCLTSSLQDTVASPWAFLALQVYTPPSKLQGLRISREQMPWFESMRNLGSSPMII